mmetsp:Transcript_28076/g.57523  ORF Transcript_28076/g.57523 Transcript_28076/m.57523 type:complete len:163 (-) Transcript_28076:43-531(-)
MLEGLKLLLIVESKETTTNTQSQQRSFTEDRRIRHLEGQVSAMRQDLKDFRKEILLLLRPQGALSCSLDSPHSQEASRSINGCEKGMDPVVQDKSDASSPGPNRTNGGSPGSGGRVRSADEKSDCEDEADLILSLQKSGDTPNSGNYLSANLVIAQGGVFGE